MASRHMVNPSLHTASRATLPLTTSSPRRASTLAVPATALPKTAATRPTRRSSNTRAARAPHTTAPHRPRTSRDTLPALAVLRVRRASDRRCSAVPLVGLRATSWVVGPLGLRAVQFSVLLG